MRYGGLSVRTVNHGIEKYVKEGQRSLIRYDLGRGGGGGGKESLPIQSTAKMISK
jgi:hypothetical protein